MNGLHAYQRSRVLHALPRMNSRDAIALLIDHLDEKLDPTGPHVQQSFTASRTAATALRKLTGIELPLDTEMARQRWQQLKQLSDELLLRKAMLEDIEALTDSKSHRRRWKAYESLGRMANQHFGKYDVFHAEDDPPGREASQKLWRAWAKQNITKPRIDWIREGFARSGIVLPDPLDADAVDLLIRVLKFYDDWGNRAGDTSRPDWSTNGGWAKARFHLYNANRLLEQLTRHCVGISPYGYDLRVNPDGLAKRWAWWWKSPAAVSRNARTAAATAARRRRRGCRKSRGTCAARPGRCT